jgi:hypothetical protein
VSAYALISRSLRRQSKTEAGSKGAKTLSKGAHGLGLCPAGGTIARGFGSACFSGCGARFACFVQQAGPHETAFRRGKQRACSCDTACARRAWLSQKGVRGVGGGASGGVVGGSLQPQGSGGRREVVAAGERQPQGRDFKG